MKAKRSVLTKAKNDQKHEELMQYLLNENATLTKVVGDLVVRATATEEILRQKFDEFDIKAFSDRIYDLIDKAGGYTSHDSIINNAKVLLEVKFGSVDVIAKGLSGVQSKRIEIPCFGKAEILPEDFEAQIKGLKKGAKRTFTFDETRGKELITLFCEVEVLRISVRPMAEASTNE